MATFISQTLSYALQGPYVMFTANAEIKFEPHEIGKEWRIEITIIEKDRLSPDDVFYDKNWGRTFSASKETISIELDVPIYKKDLNTEPGKEEIYAELKVISLKEPLIFVKTTTNIIKVNI